MIRSLIAQETAPDDSKPYKLRRNLKPGQLETLYVENEMLWLDVTDPNADELAWLERTLGLHPEVMADLQRRDKRPHLLVYPDYIFVTFFEPQLVQQRLRAVEIHCLVGDTFFVTLRSRMDTKVNEAYNRVAGKNPSAWQHGVAYLLYLTIQDIVDSYYPLLDTISVQLNSLEDELLDNGPNDSIRRKNHRLRQHLITLRGMVAPQREVLSRMLGEERFIQEDVHRDLFRHMYERLLRVYDIIDGQRDLSSNILDLLQSAESARLADVVSRLTVISMIFLPLTF
ncbi:MAG: magnesium transporter CorA family protein, partial [Anaerolineales bacterium]